MLSSSAVRRNIMCRPVTVSVASMNAANTAMPAFASGPSPTTIALKAATIASQIANATAVSRSWKVMGRRGCRRAGRRAGGSAASTARRLSLSARMTRAT